MFNTIKRLFSANKSKSHIPAEQALKKSVDSAGGQAQTESQKPIADLNCDYALLATSFNDFLLGAQPQTKQTFNDVEIFILDQLEKMLLGDIPDAAVPRLPDVAMALLKELSDPDITSAAIMAYINRDPVLAAEVLSMSNSVLFRQAEREEIINLEKALVLLGLANLKMIVSSALMKRLLVIPPVYFRLFGQHLWEHSQDCAQACQTLAKLYGQGDPDNAYLVGLFHDVGKLAIFSLLTQALGQYLNYTPRGAVFSGIVRDYSPSLSARIAQKWDLPAYLQTALLEQQNQRVTADSSVYGFILNQANILAEFKAIASRSANSGSTLETLAEQYGIPLHLFRQVFPEATN